MKQTKPEALRDCRKLWQIEAEHGTGDKKEMFELAGLDMRNYMSGCPACEYDNTHGQPDWIDFCGSTCLISWPGGGCEAYLSPFNRWEHSEATDDKKKYAAEIVQLCDTAIKKEKKSRKNLMLPFSSSQWRRGRFCGSCGSRGTHFKEKS